MVGPDDLRGLFQPIILWVRRELFDLQGSKLIAEIPCSIKSHGSDWEAKFSIEMGLIQ